jgi:hypothetical protein
MTYIHSDAVWNGVSIRAMTTDHVRNTLKFLWSNKVKRLATRGQWNNLVLELLDRKIIGSSPKGEPLFKNEETKGEENMSPKTKSDTYDYEDGPMPAEEPVTNAPRVVKRELSLDGIVFSPVSALTREQLFDLLFAQRNLDLRQDVVLPGDPLPTAGAIVHIGAK